MDSSKSGGGPVLERAGDRAYFTDRDGVRWRIYDVGFGPPHAARGRWRSYPLTSASATYRRFVSADRLERCYAFGKDELRALSTEVLARQLAGAEYLPRTSFDPTTHTNR